MLSNANVLLPYSMGSIGAGVNVQVLGFAGNLLLLLVAAAACLWDISHDYSILVYLMVGVTENASSTPALESGSVI